MNNIPEIAKISKVSQCSSGIEQCFRKAEVVGLIPTIGSSNSHEIYQMLDSFIKFFKQVNKFLLTFVGANFILILVASIANLEKHNYDAQIGYIWVLFVINSILSIYIYSKDRIIPYLFNLTTLFCSIIAIILIMHY